MEFDCPELVAGETVEATIRREDTVEGRSALHILSSGPERRLFQTAEQVKAHLDEEKAAWQR